jgi:hypothetical protein
MVGPFRMLSTRAARWLLLAGGLGAAMLLGRARWPKEQTVHYVLGDAAPRVQEVDARWAYATDVADPTDPTDPNHAAGDGAEDDWTREATFRYTPGQAPRVVTHEPRLPDGDYTVEIDIVGQSDRNTVRRRVRLAGGSTSIDLGQAVPR